AGLARAQVMDQVPADALVVLKFKNLAGTSAKLGKFLQDLGVVAAVEPGLADPLTFLEKKANITQGIRSDGDLAIVFVDPEKTTSRPDKSIVILIPVTDYAVFLNNFPNPKTEAGVSEIMLGQSPEPGYLCDWGNGYAALSPA